MKVIGGGPIGVALCACLAAWALLSRPEAPEAVDLSAVLALAVVAAGVALMVSRQRPDVVAAALVGAVLLATVVSLPGSLSADAAAPPLGYANANAALLTAATAAAVLAGWQSGRRRGKAWLGVAVLCALVSVGIGSRAAAGSCVLLVMLVPLLSRIGTTVWRWLSAPVLVAAVAGPVAIGLDAPAVGTSNAAEHRSSTAVDETVSGTRAALWGDALDMLRAHPITGQGAGTFAQHSEMAADPDLAWAHSEPLQLAAELGAVGAVLGAVLVAWVLIAAGRAAPIVAVLLLQPTVDYVLHFPVVVASFAVVVGLAVSVGTGKPGLTPGRHRRGS